MHQGSDFCECPAVNEWHLDEKSLVYTLNSGLRGTGGIKRLCIFATVYLLQYIYYTNLDVECLRGTPYKNKNVHVHLLQYIYYIIFFMLSACGALAAAVTVQVIALVELLEIRIRHVPKKVLPDTYALSLSLSLSLSLAHVPKEVL
jgi:hypothetical protein